MKEHYKDLMLSQRDFRYIALSADMKKKNEIHTKNKKGGLFIYIVELI